MSASSLDSNEKALPQRTLVAIVLFLMSRVLPFRQATAILPVGSPASVLASSAPALSLVGG